MGMQNNFRLSKTKNNILYALSGATLTLFAGLILFPAISDSTHAEGDAPDNGITITVDNEVTANLVLFDEGDYKIAKDTVSVSSSAAYGYELFLATDSEAHQSIYLNDDPTSESRIAPVSGTIAEPAVLTNNTWGFAIAGQGNFDNEYDPSNPDPASRFAIIPTAADQQAVFENNAATAEDNIDFYYGIKVEPTLEVGEYTTSAAYTAIAKEKPFTAKAILGDNGNLNFVYDRNDYATGDTYVDNIGETTIVDIYTIPMNNTGCTGATHMPWYRNSHVNIGNVNIDASFIAARPTSICSWFSELRNISSIANLQNLNTDNVTDMSYAFYNAGYSARDNFTLNLGSWDTGNVTNISSIFYYAGYNAKTIALNGIGNWNVSNVTNMNYAFGSFGYSARTFNLDLSSWKTDSAITMLGMFYNAGYIANVFRLNLSTWKTSSVTQMGNMFRSTGGSAKDISIIGLSDWDTSSVINMSSMFENTGSFSTTWSIGDLSKWNTGNVTNMRNMFSGAGNSTAATWSIGDLSKWNTGNVTNMREMFYGAGSNTTSTWNIGNLGYIDEGHKGWDTKNVTDMSSMFAAAGSNAATWNVGDISGWDVTNVTNHSGFINLNANQSNASVVNNQPNWND